MEFVKLSKENKETVLKGIGLGFVFNSKVLLGWNPKNDKYVVLKSCNYDDKEYNLNDFVVLDKERRGLKNINDFTDEEKEKLDNRMYIITSDFISNTSFNDKSRRILDNLDVIIKRKYRFSVSTTYVGSKVMEEVELEFEGYMTEDEIEKEVEDFYNEWLFENINTSWGVVE